MPGASRTIQAVCLSTAEWALGNSRQPLVRVGSSDFAEFTVYLPYSSSQGLHKCHKCLSVETGDPTSDASGNGPPGGV